MLKTILKRYENDFEVFSFSVLIQTSLFNYIEDI